jgi:hypothetical protein
MMNVARRKFRQQPLPQVSFGPFYFFGRIAVAGDGCCDAREIS